MGTVCLDYTRGNGVPATPNLPYGYACADGLRSQVFFPSCWNGADVDSKTHNTHVAYPDGMDNGVCPPGFPKRLISLFYEVTWNTFAFEPFRGQAMNTTQPFVYANGDPTGYGLHGDFLNGWDVPTLQQAVNNCTDDSGGAPSSCGRSDAPKSSRSARSSTCSPPRTSAIRRRSSTRRSPAHSCLSFPAAIRSPTRTLLPAPTRVRRLSSRHRNRPFTRLNTRQSALRSRPSTPLPSRLRGRPAPRPPTGRTMACSSIPTRAFFPPA